MEFRDLSVVLVKKSDDIACEIIPILSGQLSDDGAVDCDIARVSWIRDIDENVSWMHISMKKVVVEHLGEKRFDATFG